MTSAGCSTGLKTMSLKVDGEHTTAALANTAQVWNTLMNDHTVQYFTDLQSIRRGVKEGWYAVDKDGNLTLGPFSTRDSCIRSVPQSTS